MFKNAKNLDQLIKLAGVKDALYEIRKILWEIAHTTIQHDDTGMLRYRRDNALEVFQQFENERKSGFMLSEDLIEKIRDVVNQSPGEYGAFHPLKYILDDYVELMQNWEYNLDNPVPRSREQDTFERIPWKR